MLHNVWASSVAIEKQMDIKFWEMCLPIKILPPSRSSPLHFHLFFYLIALAFFKLSLSPYFFFFNFCFYDLLHLSSCPLWSLTIPKALFSEPHSRRPYSKPLSCGGQLLGGCTSMPVILLTIFLFIHSFFSTQPLRYSYFDGSSSQWVSMAYIQPHPAGVGPDTAATRLGVSYLLFILSCSQRAPTCSCLVIRTSQGDEA